MSNAAAFASAPPPPPSSPASARYERAFRSWSYSSPPPSEVQSGDAETSQGQGALTYAVYTAQDNPVAPRASRVNFAPAPQPAPLHTRVGMMAVGAAIVLCTAAAIVLGAVDDGPKAARSNPTSASMAPPPALDPSPIDPSSVTTTTSFIPPVVTIVDDPAAPAPAPKPRKKKVVNPDAPIVNVSAPANNANANGAPAAPPPNPYAISKK